jgi:hypothetical protein
MDNLFTLAADMNEYGYTDSLNFTHEFNANRPTILESASAGILFLVQFAMISRNILYIYWFSRNILYPIFGTICNDQPEAPGATVQERKKGVAQRLKNSTAKEDGFLCSAYLNISKDPIVGVHRMSAYFNEHKTMPYVRSLSSLQHRWSDIQKDTSGFCGFFAEVERINQSGKSKNDKVRMQDHCNVSCVILNLL